MKNCSYGVTKEVFLTGFRKVIVFSMGPYSCCLLRIWRAYADCAYALHILNNQHEYGPVIMKWKYKRDVVLLSIFHDDSMENVTTRQGVTQKPFVVLDYKKNMGGVDRNDGQLQSYKLAREHLKKYYQKMFRYLLNVVCLNTFIIYKKMGGSISRLDFLLTLAESLSSMGGVVEPATRGRPSKSPKPSRLLGHCFPDMVPGTSKKKPTRRCVVCWANGKRKEPSYWCSNCEKALCLVPCFQVYHTDKNFKNLKKKS